VQVDAYVTGVDVSVFVVIREEITIQTAKTALSGESYDIYCGYGFDLEDHICAEDMVTINVVSRRHKVKGDKHNTPSPTNSRIGGTTPAPTNGGIGGATPAPTNARGVITPAPTNGGTGMHREMDR
jgi:hypothetical protein